VPALFFFFQKNKRAATMISLALLLASLALSQGIVVVRVDTFDPEARNLAQTGRSEKGKKKTIFSLLCAVFSRFLVPCCLVDGLEARRLFLVSRCVDIDRGKSR
jgi:hypothetical protein